MESNRVFILGAGTSKGAGLPLRNEFFNYESGPIRWVMDKDEERNIESLRRCLYCIKKNISIEGLSDIEKVWNKVLDFEKPRREYFEKILKDLLVRRIIYSMENYFSSGENEYIERHKECMEKFLKMVDEHKNPIITLNYDTIVEETHGKDKFWYGKDIFLNWSKDKMLSNAPEKIAKIKLFKLHGSINWFYCDKCKQIKYLRIGELGSLYASGDFYCFKCGSIYRFCMTHTEFEESRLKENGGTFPQVEVVVLPMNKEKYNRNYKLVVNEVWDSAKKELENANEIIIIGYASIDVDKDVKDLIINAIRKNKNKDTLKIEVVCPDRDRSIRENTKIFFTK